MPKIVLDHWGLRSLISSLCKAFVNHIEYLRCHAPISLENSRFEDGDGRPRLPQSSRCALPASGSDRAHGAISPAFTMRTTDEGAAIASNVARRRNFLNAWVATFCKAAAPGKR